jgi:DivIVA domain-containing protein
LNRGTLRYFAPEEIENYEFLYSMPGYNRAEVRAFLQAIAGQVRSLQERLDEAESTGARSEVAGLVAAAEDATREVLNAAEARMKTAATDLRSELDAFRLQIASLIAEVTTRMEEVVIASQTASSPAREGPVAKPALGISEPDVTTRASPLQESEEQEIPPEWEELMREPEAEE